MLNSFFVLKDAETDESTCWFLRGDESNAVLADWEASQQKCGQNRTTPYIAFVNYIY